jgi:two-component system phosphate regulon sensor histidine kinase PhoR
MWRSRTFWRLFGTYGLLWLISIAVLGAGIVGQVEQNFLQQIEGSLQARAVLVRETVRGRPASEMSSLQERIEQVRRETGTRITLLAADGTVLADSDRDPRRYELENHLNRPEIRAAQENPFGVSRRRHSATVDRDMMYVALRTDDSQGAVAFVRVALALDSIQEQLARLHRIVWTAVAVTAIIGVALAFWLARRSTRPLQELTTGAEVIARGCYDYRVYAAGKDEVGTLARAFNAMSEQLTGQFAQLEEDRRQLLAILSGMVEGVIALDADQRILFVNDRAALLLEFRATPVVGRRLWEVVRQRALQEVVQRALAGREPISQELTWNGAVTRSLTVHAARLAESPTRGAVLVLHDTSELRRLERLRQDFVANVSHELKTPLSVIKACIETLLDGAADDPQHRGPFLQQVADQAERLHALILDLISLARIESGQEIFEFREVPLAPLVAACLERHRARAEAKGQTLEAVAPEAGAGSRSGPGAWADEEAVSEILDNLVDNALKYTPSGGRIRVQWHREDGQVCLAVADTGIGIPDPDLPRVFERFYRVDKARSRELGGTGLGLAIVKHLVQAMHGSVAVTSRLGEGTTFTVRLPPAPGA